MRERTLTIVAVALMIFLTYSFFYEMFGYYELMLMFATPIVLIGTIAWLLINRKAKHGN